ncbi:MAG: amidohydrolase family protein [Chromatiales bacterium]|jgi:predicted TIM-barrel fold metal-dependent hydrolase
MKTVDIHTHLLNPHVKFDRLFDKITLRFFAKSLGVEAHELQASPYPAYVDAMARNIRESQHVDKACLFAVDARLDEAGQEIDRDGTVCAMTEDVLQVMQQYPDEFIAFFSINPRRPDALERIDAAVENGCRGAKFLQNYWGLDCNDKRLIPYYEKLREHNIPLIIHIGSEYSIHSFAEYERISMLDLPLACGVTVIAAHMGLGRINHKLLLWRNLSKNPQYFDADYFRLLEMLEQHDNLYADLAAILAPLRARALRHLSQQQQVHHKILFGTDYPVPFTTRYNTYDLAVPVRKRLAETANPFDRYAEILLEYFPPGNPIYDNHKKVLG